jgi:hypothetical protein
LKYMLLSKVMMNLYVYETEFWLDYIDVFHDF